MSIPINIRTISAETTFLLTGPAGDLEILLSKAPEVASTSYGIAIICHPHPLHGGTMHNKVITTLSKTFEQLNLQTLRFNFRGVGKSTGRYAEGRGEQDDLVAIVEWLKQTVPEAVLWLAGFSFGAAIAIRTAGQMPFAGLVSIAPPVNYFSLEEVPSITCPWIVVLGDQDDIVPLTAVLEWLKSIEVQPILVRFPEAGHFFHGQLTELKAALMKELKRLI